MTFDKKTMPIDVVLTWVSSDDPVWVKKRDEALGCASTCLDDNASSNVRWHDKEELRYALRSLWENAPWVNHIYIVTDAQIPEWLNDQYPKITIVDHKEIFPDTNCLPVFNSHAIEACLHNIATLSEHFIYLNDDILISRPVEKSDFYTEGGECVFYAKHSTKVPDPKAHSAEEVSVYDAAAMTARALIVKETGYDCDRRVTHAPITLIKSHLHKMESVFNEAIQRTRCAKFRSQGDVPLPSFMYPWYGWTQGWVEMRTLERKSDVVGGIPLAKWSFIKKTIKVFVKRPMFLNINDSENGSVPLWLRKLIVRKVVGRLFPHPAPWERENT